MSRQNLRTIKPKNMISTLIIYCLLLPVNHAIATDANVFGDRIFQFQRKLALKGNKLAQYKLGTFYEFGISVKPDIGKAKVWYKNASKKGYKPAVNRLTYHNIKKNGYSESKHSDWKKNILESAKLKDSNGLILLGQMYQHGIAVKKDLKKALELLKNASSLGRPEIDKDIDKLSAKINRKKKTKKVKSIITPIKKKIESVKKQKDKKTLSKEERELRNKKLMKKYYHDQFILQQQQEWTESEEWSDSE